MAGRPIHIIKIKVVQVGGRHLKVSFFMRYRQHFGKKLRLFFLKFTHCFYGEIYIKILRMFLLWKLQKRV
ncbi:hypothetical protein DN398_25355 [Bacillus sp. JAS102]|nr:hypothetical protein DN398_25355 [Bacillus sp. JAS102]